MTMKRQWLQFAIALASLSLSACLLAPGAKAQNAKESDELVGMVQKWLDAEASNNRATLQKMISDDFIGTSFGGTIVSKDDIVPPMQSGDRHFPKSSIKESIVRVFGNAGVVMGRIAPENASQPMGFRFTIVFSKQPQGWQMIAAHLSRPPAPQPQE
jgi:ketosteroid isomerase-like protein